MSEELLQGKVTGEVLRAYDQLIRGWVNDQIKRIELSSGMVTEEQVKNLIQEALSSFDAGLSEEEVRAIVTAAIAESESNRKSLLTVSGVDIHTISEFRNAIGASEDVVLPASIHFQNVKVYYAKDSTENNIAFKDSVIWVAWEPATETQGRKLNFFGEDFRSVSLVYASNEEEVASNPNFTLVDQPITVNQEINSLSTRLDAVESGFGSVDIPAWIGQVIPIDSTVSCKNVNDVNALVWPGQDFTSRANHSSTIFLGKVSGIHLITRSPGGSAETALTVVIVNQPAMLSVRYDDSGAWVDIYTLGVRYSLRSLNAVQEYFEYDTTDATYHAEYKSLPTISSVQTMIDVATADALTEARAQAMIDSSVGAAISDSY